MPRCGRSQLRRSDQNPSMVFTHMHFTHAVAIVIACELTPSMVDMLMTVAPGLQTGINAVLISIHKGAWIKSVFDQRLDVLCFTCASRLITT